MESIDSIWQVGILALIAGIMIGLLGYRLFGRSTREGDKVQAELDATRDELANYKASVNEHFDKTSELVNDLTQNYVRVYQHLAEGATSLGDGRTFNNLIERHPGKVSLTVDGETRPPEPDFDDSVVEAAAPAEVPPEAAVEVEESGSGEAATDTAPEAKAVGEETVSETAAAEPAADAASASQAPSEESPAAAETSAEAASDEPGQKTDPAEPALNVDALDETAGKETADAASVMPDEEGKSETSRTVH